MPARHRAAPAGSMTAATVALAVLAGLTAAISQSAPVPAPDNPPAGWRVECTGDGKTLDCRAVQ
jgi:invasion protein IalB